MTAYTIRSKGIDGNYQPNTFTASTFAAIKKELTRDGSPWLSNWSVHTEDGCIFSKEDWYDALTCVESGESASTITLKLLRECREHAKSEYAQ